MPLRVAIYKLRGNGRSQRIGDHMAAGISTSGDLYTAHLDDAYLRPDADVATFYGFEGRLPQVMKDYTAAGLPVVYIDLGYWGRQEGGRFNGYHKVSLNARHPTAYFMAKKRTNNRIKKHNIVPRPWKRGGRHILLAGMSDRAALSVGLRPNEWEQKAIAEIRRHTDRPIIYRPKPSWRGAVPLEGARFSGRDEQLGAALDDCHAVVTRHSNVAVDALVAGVPVFCFDGVAVPMGLQDLSKIETPAYPDGREQWAANVAYCQWSVQEIASGKMWRFLKDDGLIP